MSATVSEDYADGGVQDAEAASGPAVDGSEILRRRFLIQLRMLILLQTRPMYQGTVSRKEKLKRRRQGRVAKQSRKVNR